MIRKISLVIYEPTTDDVAAVLHLYGTTLSSSSNTATLGTAVDVQAHGQHDVFLEAVITKAPF